MADILIRGMEMPSCCLMCPMYTISGCRVSKRIFPDWMNVAAVPKDCPIVPLPEGHGRLIDADALVSKYTEEINKLEEWAKIHEKEGRLDMFRACHLRSAYLSEAKLNIEAAPTIIEADLEWKMKNCCCFSNTDQAEGGEADEKPV